MAEQPKPDETAAPNERERLEEKDRKELEDANTGVATMTRRTLVGAQSSLIRTSALGQRAEASRDKEGKLVDDAIAKVSSGMKDYGAKRKKPDHYTPPRRRSLYEQIMGRDKHPLGALPHSSVDGPRQTNFAEKVTGQRHLQAGDLPYSPMDGAPPDPGMAALDNLNGANSVTQGSAISLSKDARPKDAPQSSPVGSTPLSPGMKTAALVTKGNIIPPSEGAGPKDAPQMSPVTSPPKASPLAALTGGKPKTMSPSLSLGLTKGPAGPTAP